MGSYQKAPQKGITKLLQYLLRGSFVLLLFQLIINRYKKKSFYWYKEVIESNGETLDN
ncbi:phospho-beta-glucosidase%2C truncation [Streptococcus pneumoniae]|nr:phospho-beta-glucosidase%2C truncation [Streptococcus pneumoniae]CVQ73059.1 phospho-beta-glucosidase%2C truncation [Streptococcus pneumoniae]